MLNRFEQKKNIFARRTDKTSEIKHHQKVAYRKRVRYTKLFLPWCAYEKIFIFCLPFPRPVLLNFWTLFSRYIHDAWNYQMIYKTLSTIVYNIWLMCINLEPTQPKYLFLRIFILFLKHYSLSVYFRCIFGSAILNSHKHLLFFLYFKIALGHRPLFSNAAFCVFLQASFV